MQTEHPVFPFTMDMHVPDREFSLGFKAAIRQFRARGEKNGAWAIFINGTKVVSGNVDGEVTRHAVGNAFILPIEKTDKIRLELPKDANNNVQVTVNVTGTGVFE